MYDSACFTLTCDWDRWQPFTWLQLLYTLIATVHAVTSQRAKFDLLFKRRVEPGGTGTRSNVRMCRHRRENEANLHRCDYLKQHRGTAKMESYMMYWVLGLFCSLVETLDDLQYNSLQKGQVVSGWGHPTAGDKQTHGGTNAPHTAHFLCSLAKW